MSARAAPEVSERVAKPGQRPVTPYRGIVYSKEDIEHLRQMVRTDPRSRRNVKRYFEIADKWMAMSRSRLRELMPPHDAVYAYGLAGDPKTGQSWSRFGGGGICSLDRPGEVRSPYTDDVYGIQKPGERYYDDGGGWVRPSDGKHFYFKGIWNSYVARKFINSLQPLALTYALSGDDRIAERALFILDLMADRIADPLTPVAPADWPSAPRPLLTFLNYTGNQANTRVCIATHAFDVVAGGGRAEHASWARPDKTLLGMMRDRLLLVREPRNITGHDSLQNHALSAYGANLATGLLFDDEKKIRESIEATYAFLDNTVNRDGVYYEQSGNYEHTGLGYGGRLITLLTHLQPNSTEGASVSRWSGLMPDRPAFANDPRWFSVAVRSLYERTVMGRDIDYGDSKPDEKTKVGADSRNLRNLRNDAVWLHETTTVEPWKRLCERVYWALPQWVRNQSRTSLFSGGAAQWGELPRPSEDEASFSLLPKHSMLSPAKRLTLLRDGSDQSRRALFMRGGSNNSHAHDDQLAMQLYADGMLATGEFGYTLWGVPAHEGYGTQPIAHNTVVVNENLPLPPNHFLFRKDVPDASIVSYLSRGPIQLVEMSNPQRWKGVGLKEYRRTLGLVHVGPEAFYAVDLFRVAGGEVHDYAWHGPNMSAEPDQPVFEVQGADPQPRQGVWTLAALGGKHQDASYNQPGQSWGERIEGHSSLIKSLGIALEGDVTRRRWNPPPGNGYGFVFDVKAQETNRPWRAIWRLHDGKHQMRLTMLNPDGQTMVTAKSGSLTVGKYYRMIVARRRSQKGQSLRSRFVSVSEVARPDHFPVAETHWLDLEGSDDPKDRIGFRVVLKDVRIDRILSTTGPDQWVRGGGVRLRGRYGLVRTDPSGQVSDAVLVEGTELMAPGIRLTLNDSSWHGKVRTVRPGSRDNTVTVSQDLPPAAALIDSIVRFDSPPGRDTPYTASEAFHIKAPAQGSATPSHTLRLGEQQLIDTYLQVKRIDKDGLVELAWPNELFAYPEAGRFNGAQIVVAGAPSRTTRLVRFEGKRELRVAEPDQLRVGDRLEVRATQPGDRYTIPAYAVLHRVGPGHWTLQTNQDTSLVLPDADGAAFTARFQPDQQPQPLPATTGPHGAKVRIPLNDSMDGRVEIWRGDAGPDS